MISVENLKWARKEAGLTQAELAKKVGVSKFSVSAWERGLQVPEARSLEKLSSALCVSEGFLLGYTEPNRICYLPQAELALQFVESPWEMDNADRDRVRRFILDWGKT